MLDVDLKFKFSLLAGVSLRWPASCVPRRSRCTCAHANLKILESQSTEDRAPSTGHRALGPELSGITLPGAREKNKLGSYWELRGVVLYS